MSTKRVLSTELVLAGEREYKAALTDINRELRVLDSELKLTDNQFKGMQNTVTALEAKNKALNEVIGKHVEKLNLEKAAMNSMKDLQDGYAKKLESAKKALADLSDNTDDATKETEEYKKQVAAIQAEINKWENAEHKAAVAVDGHAIKANAAQMKINDLNGELAKNEKHLNEAKNSTDGCATSIDAMGREMKETASQAEDFGAKSKAGVDGLATALAAAGVTATVKAIGDALAECSKASMDFESTMAGVAKTTDMTKEELAEMSEEVQRLSMEIPMTTTELGHIMEIGGQLGIGRENLVQFTETMAALGVATNMTSEEAATMLAQIRSITGIGEGELSNLGSSVVALGNNFATNERKIADMTQGIAGAGVNAKMSTADMAGLSAAVTSLGIESGTGATNMSKLIGEMQTAVETGEGLDDWARAAGMSAAEFARLWREDATGALTAFIGGINNLDESALVMLNTLGITDQRTVRMVTSLANAESQSQMLTSAIALSNSAWEQNTALTNEAAMRYATTESKLTLFKNSVNNLKIAIGDQLNPALKNMMGTGTDVTKWATDFVKTHPEFVKLAVAVVATGTAFVGVATALGVVMKVWQSLGPLLSANPWALAAAGVAAVVVGLVTLIATSQETNEEIDRLNKTSKDIETSMKEAESAYQGTASQIDATAAVAERYIARLKELEGQSSMTKAEQDEYASIVEKLQILLPEVNLELDEQTGLLKDGAAAIESQTKAWKEAAREEAMREHTTELIKGQVEAELALLEAQTLYKTNQKDITGWETRRGIAIDGINNLLGTRFTETAKAVAAETALATGMSKLSESEIAAVQTWIAELRLLEPSISNVAGENATLEGTIATLTESVEEAGGKVSAFEEVMGKLETSTQGAGDGTGELSQSILDLQDNAAVVVGEMDALKKAYEESYKAAYENISNSMGLFEEMKTGTKQSIDDMISSLNSQIVFMDTYAENLDKAAEMGVDKGLLARLSDGSTESAAYLQAIVDGGDTKITELNTAFGRVEEGKDDFATNVATMETDFDNAAKEIETRVGELVTEFNQKVAASEAGAATIQGVIDGMNSKMGELNTMVSTVNAALNFKSYTVARPVTGGSPQGNFAAGLTYVPSDDYLANLHEGEMVLTRLQAKAYRAEQLGSYGIQKHLQSTVNNNAHMPISVSVQGMGKSGDKVGRIIADTLQRELRRRGIVHV